MDWFRELQNRVSSLYSNITFVKTSDEKRIDELIEKIKNGIPLNALLPTAKIENIYLIDGANNLKYLSKEKDWKMEITTIDDFDTPLQTILNIQPKNSVIIYYRILNLDENTQAQLLSIARDTAFMNSNHILIFTEDLSDINKVLLSYSNQIDIPLSSPSERELLINDFLEKIKDTMDDDRKIIEDIGAVVRATSGLNLMQFESLLYEGLIEFLIKENRNIPASWFAKKKVDMINREETFRLNNPEHGLDAFASPKIIKDYIYRRIINVIKNFDKAREIGLKYPDGLLLFGMQGTGKTWLARAIAKEINIPFMEFNISSIMSKYVGDTEKNMEKMIKILEAIQPAVLFIDEIDSIALKRSDVNLDSGVSRKMINRLMSWLAEDKQVLVIGSTNRPEQMDEAFIRSGRFSFKIPILLPDQKTRAEIFNIHLNLRKAKYENIDFTELARKSRLYSGADIVKLVDDALFFAFENDSIVKMEHFDEAFKEILVNTQHNKELQEEYLKYAEKFGTNKRLIEAYRNIDRDIEESNKIDLIKNLVRG